MQFTGHEEGRIRGLYDNAASPHTLTGFAYDYFLKDHLGNTRAVLTEEQKTLYYPAATLEGTYSATNPQANSMINHASLFAENATSLFADFETLLFAGYSMIYLLVLPRYLLVLPRYLLVLIIFYQGQNCE